MTRLPVETWDLKARTDLEPYELNEACAVCGGTPVENHHIVRRSFGGKDFTETWWIELPDGKVMPNRTGLCGDCHRPITENEAQIVLEADGTFVYSNPAGGKVLNPQPGPAKKVHGKACVKCKGSGVEPPEKPKPETPEKPRPKVTISFRVPKDDREDGYEIFHTLLGQAKEILVPKLGWQENVPPYYVLVAVLVSFLQQHDFEENHERA